MAPRSYLYVPGDTARLLDGAAGRGADALVLDLEDAVAADRKQAARRLVADHLAQVEEGPGPERWVRLNAEALELDAAAVVGPNLAGVFLPEADLALVRRADDVLAALERARGLDPGAVRAIALVESAAGLRDAAALAAHPRVARLGLGEADLAADLGVVPGAEREEMWPYRAQVVLAGALGGCDRPVGPVETAVRDLQLLERGTHRLLRQGFRARTCLAPAQLDVVHRVFTPSGEEVARARAVLDALATASDAGSAVALDPEGHLVDEAVARSAREVLERAGG